MAAKLHEEKVIFFRAIEIVSAEDRAVYLDEACGGDDELRAQVDALIRQHERPQRLLDAAQTRRETELFESVVIGRNDPTDSDRDQTQALDEVPLDFLEPTDHPGSLGRLDQYQVLEVVGRGGMGIVFKAQDTKLNRVVAIKVLAPELASNATARKRFLREAQAAAAVSHDHVVTTHAVEDGNSGLPYLVMEFIDGRSLQEKLDHDGQLELKEILRIGRQIAAGLAAAHEQGLIHRDVKPSNILLQNGVQRVQITDFGLARAVDDVGMTRTGEVTGTPQFMSPEQAQGHPVDARSDLFSLGSVLYAMCAGRSPFRAETTMASLRRVCDDTPRPIREINPDIPDWLAAIIDRLLEKNADDRFQTSLEVAELLGKHLAHLQDPGSTPFPGTVRPLKRHSAIGGRRRRWLVAGLVLLSVATSFGVTEGTGVTQVTQSVISIVRGDGTLIVEVDDPNIGITIEGDDLVITGAGPQEVRLKPGHYRLHAEHDGTPVPLEEELVTIDRGGRQVVRVTVANRPAPLADRITEIRRFVGHNSTINGLAFMPDGNEVISASADQSVIIWNTATGDPLNIWADFESPISAIAVSADGQWVAICEHSGRITLHNRTDRQVHSFTAHESRICSAAFSGSSLVTASHDGTARQWDVETGTEIRSLADPGHHMLGVATSADGRYALITGNSAWFWNLETGNVELRLDPAHSGWCAAILPDGSQAVIGHGDGVVRRWDLTTGQVVRQIPAHSTPVTWITVTQDGRHCISSGWDRTLKIFELESGRNVAEISADTQCLRRFELSPDGRQLLSGGGDFHDSTSDMWTTDGDYDIRLWQLPESLWPQQTSVWSANSAQTIADNVFDASDDFERAAGIGHRGLTQCPDVPWFDASVEPLYLSLVTNDEIYQRVLRLASTHQTPRAELLAARGCWLAREKRFLEARTVYEQRLALGTARAGMWFADAVVLLALHDDDSYRQLCDQILNQFEDSESFPLEATYSRWALVLAPHEIQDPDGMLRLADVGVRFILDPIDPVLGHGVHGACLYRIGRYEEAIRSLETCAAADESPGHSALGLTFLPFLAMAHHELGHDEEAAAWRDRVHEWNDNGAEGADWYHTVILDRLIEEMDSEYARQDRLGLAHHQDAFVLLNAQGTEVAPFDTLAEAVRGSQPGDTIEIRGNGPFVTDSIEIDHPLVIRAADGYWPVIQSNTMEAQSNTASVLEASDMVVLEGLEFTQVGQPPEGFTSLIARNAPIYVSNCRIRSMADMAGIYANQGLTVRNSMLIVERAGACLGWYPSNTDASCHAENCILVGGTNVAPPTSYENSGSAGAHFSRCTFLKPAPPSLAAIVYSKDQRPPDEDRTWLELDLRETIFDSVAWLTAINVNYGQLDAPFLSPDVQTRIPQWFPRTGSHNLYRAGVSIFVLRVDSADVPNRFTIESDDRLESWQEFLGHPEPGSTIGDIRFSGGDLRKLAELAPDELAPEDFRLRSDSAGFEAGPNGEDLGVNVDFVGPGEAYRRWKLTEEYSEWQEQTAELMRNGQEDAATAASSSDEAEID